MKTALLLVTLLFASNFNFAQTTAIPDTSFEQALIDLNLDSGPIDGVVLTANIDTLTYLDIQHNWWNPPILVDTIYDLTGIQDFTDLTYLDCGYHQISSLDLSMNTNLTFLNCTTNVISNLNISQNIALTTLSCGENLFSSLDLSQHTALANLTCFDNPNLNCLNVRNGNNHNFGQFFGMMNPNLACIEVDDTAYSAANWTYIDAWVSFSTNCGNLCSSAICNVSSGFNYVDNGAGNYSLTNTTIGNYNQVHWAFGDGVVDMNTSATHTFNANGNYTVVLAVSDTPSTCMDYYYTTINVTGVVSPMQCNAGFVMYPDTSSTDITVINSSTGNNLTYFWDFDDGTTSTLQNPTHTYANNNYYNLCLTVDDGSGCNDTYCQQIGPNGVFKKAGFTINVSSPIATDIVNTTHIESIISINPNPTSEQLSINLEEVSTGVLSIRNTLGQIIQTEKFNNTKVLNLDLEGQSGIYFLQLEIDGQTITKKIVKE